MQPYCHPNHYQSNNNNNNNIETNAKEGGNNHQKKILYLNEGNISLQNMYFMEAIKNKIIQGIFTRLIYSTSLFSINSIYYVFNINVMHVDHFYNKIMYNFNPNQGSLTKIKELEMSILLLYESNMKTKKEVQYKIHNILNSGNVKIFKDAKEEGKYKMAMSVLALAPAKKTNYSAVYSKNVYLCLKIIGVWESNTEYGLIYKFI